MLFTCWLIAVEQSGDDKSQSPLSRQSVDQAHNLAYQIKSGARSCSWNPTIYSWDPSPSSLSRQVANSIGHAWGVAAAGLASQYRTITETNLDLATLSRLSTQVYRSIRANPLIIVAPMHVVGSLLPGRHILDGTAHGFIGTIDTANQILGLRPGARYLIG